MPWSRGKFVGGVFLLPDPVVVHQPHPADVLVDELAEKHQVELNSLPVGSSRQITPLWLNNSPAAAIASVSLAISSSRPVPRQ